MNSFKIEALATVATRGRLHDEVTESTINDLIDDGLIECRPPNTRTFKLTEKGRIMMNAIQTVPQPIVAYTMPGKE